LKLLEQYAKQHITTRKQHPNDPWDHRMPLVSENFHADEGFWIDRMIGFNKGKINTQTNKVGQRLDRNRGVDYFHSTFNDIILSYFFGIRPLKDGAILVSPVVGQDISRFAVDRVRIAGAELAVLFDPTGSHYRRPRYTPPCAGLCVYVDGKLANFSRFIAPLRIVVSTSS